MQLDPGSVCFGVAKDEVHDEIRVTGSPRACSIAESHQGEEDLMEIEVDHKGPEVVVTIDGNIDTDGGQKLSLELGGLMEMNEIRKVVFDLTTVRSTTSSGIGKLMNFYKHLDSIGAKMEISGISDILRQQFMDIHLDRIISINAN